MDMTPGITKLSQFWGSIQESVYSRATTAQLWASVRDAASSAGFELSGVNINDMSQLRSLAVSQREAMENFREANPEWALNSSMIAQDISSRPLAEQANSPLHLAKFQWQSQSEGISKTEWKTSTWEGLLPPTKQDVLDQLELDGQQLADAYEAEHAGIGDVFLLAI